MVFIPLDSIVRHDVGIDGATRFTSRSVRQSNDWIVTRSPSLASRTASTLLSPSSCWWFANSTMRMPFLEMRPTSVTRPTCE